MKNRIFGSHENHSLRGKLLVATEKLSGTEFEKSVIYLLQHDSESGTFGVILNRPADEEIKEHWRTMSGSPEHVETQLIHGGPVGGQVFAIHKIRALGDMEMPGDIFVSASVEAIQQLFDSSPDDYRIYLGIAGWKADQLEGELDEGCWYVMESDPEDIFDRADWFWERAIFRYGEQAFCHVLNLSINELPLDPTLN